MPSSDLPPRPLWRRRQFLLTAMTGAAGAAVLPRLFGQSGAPRRKLGVALIGLGGYSTGQLGPALRVTQFCELRGVVTGDAAKGRRWARDYGFPESSVYSYDTMDRIADNPDIDIVYSVTPPGLHKRDVLTGAAAGKHVICEKPMAVSVAECEEMIAACEQAGVRLGMGYRLHYHPFHQQVKDFAANNGWGGPVQMDGGFAYRMGGGSGWRLNKALAGGGQLLNVGIYVIQSACMAAGEELPVAISASEPPKKRPELFNEVEETINFTMEFANGSVCDGVSSGDFGANHFQALAPRHSLRIAPAFSYDGLRLRLDGEPVEPVDGFFQQAAQMDAFAADVINGTPSIVPGEMGLRDMRIIEAIYEASATGKKVMLS